MVDLDSDSHCAPDSPAVRALNPQNSSSLRLGRGESFVSKGMYLSFIIAAFNISKLDQQSRGVYFLQKRVLSTGVDYSLWDITKKRKSEDQKMRSSELHRVKGHDRP